MENTLSAMQFYIFTDLQGSQTAALIRSQKFAFYIFTDLQGSQTRRVLSTLDTMFYIFTDLQGSQTLHQFLVLLPAVLHLY